MKRELLLCAAALMVACLFVDGRALEGYLLADDYTIIGSFWGKGPRYLLGLLAADEIGGVWDERFLRPVRPWSLALDGWIWGLEPLGFLLTNLLLHAGASALVAALVLQLGGGLLAALLAALLFLLHPLNVEVAAWISGRDESLAGVALLGAVACYFAATNGRRRFWLGSSYALFAVSLFAKEYALLLPPALWALAVLTPPAGESRLHALGGSISRTIPFLGVIAVFLALRFHVTGHLLGGYGEGSEAHTVPRLDLLAVSVARFGRDLAAPLAARPFASAALALGLLVPLVMTKRVEGRKLAILVFWAFLWPILFLLPTHNLIYTPRHLYIAFSGMAVAFGLVLAQARGKWQACAAGLVGAALAVLLAPPTLAAVDDFTRMSNRCRVALSSIEPPAKAMPRGDVLVLVGMPAHKTPPWGFGWSLEDALRPPFVADPLDSRLELVYRRQWRPEAWGAFRGKYPGRGIQVLAWNPAFEGIEFLRAPSQRSSRQIETTGPGRSTLPGR